MFPLFLIKILCYTYRPFTFKLASSVFICAGCRLILKDQKNHSERPTCEAENFSEEQ